jgi:hypothetical protein
VHPGKNPCADGEDVHSAERAPRDVPLAVHGRLPATRLRVVQYVIVDLVSIEKILVQTSNTYMEKYVAPLPPYFKSSRVQMHYK